MKLKKNLLKGDWSRLLRFTKRNVAAVPNKPINYKFFDYYGRTLYMGSTKVGRHRLQSYYQKDCFDAHPTKAGLRALIHYFAWKPAASKRAALALDRKFKYPYDYR
ncbi:MAG: hypothetical protein DRP08_03545 [Candidatus Aenigmatarchaeota archaeon]|nr:MAG: hypothetical protein DRP08_03545 [Candidatus Aenigmarchaeota archaeon]